MNDDLEFFTHRELECPRSAVVSLAPGFGAALDDLRRAFGRPMKVNSCCRSVAHNKAIGGHPRSLHVMGNAFWRYRDDYAIAALRGEPLSTCAVDIHVPDGEYRGALIAAAWSRCWSVGIAATFLHLDRRSDYLPLVQTTYLY